MSCSGNGVYIPVTQGDCCGEGAKKHLSSGTIPAYDTESVRLSDTVGSMLRAIENGDDIWLDLTDQGESVQAKVTRVGDKISASYVTKYDDGTGYMTVLEGTLEGDSANALVMDVTRYNLTDIDHLEETTPSEGNEVVIKTGEEEGKPVFKKFSLRNLAEWVLNRYTTMISGNSQTVVEAIENMGGTSPYTEEVCGNPLTIPDAQEGYLRSAVVSFTPSVEDNKIEKKTVEITVTGRNVLEPTVYEIDTGVYGGSVNFANGEVVSSWNYLELPLSWVPVGDPKNGYQVYYKAFEAEEPVGNGVFTHGAYPFDHDNPTEEACYYDGEYLWLAVPTSITSLNDYLVAQADLGTPLAICYEVAEDTTVARSEQIPSYAGVTYTTNGNNLCVKYDYDPAVRFNKYPDPPAEEGDYMLVAHVGSNTTYEWIPYIDADTTAYCI